MDNGQLKKDSVALAVQEATAGYQLSAGKASLLPPGYKQTEVGVIPEDWEVRPIKSVCRLINGRGFKPFEWEKTGLPIIRIQNLNGSDEFNFYQGIYDKKLEVEHGQLLFAWSGSRGTSFGPHLWLGSLGLLNYHTWKVQILESEVDKGFFLHALKHLTSFIEGKAHGASALVHTQKWEMEGFEFALPSTKTEQQAIAEALSDADALIESLDQLITKKRQIKQGTMQELLTGKMRLPGFSGEREVKRLGDVAEIVMGQSPSSSNYNAKGLGLPLIQGNADIANRKTIRRIFTTEFTKRGKCGDILMSVRAPVGEISRAVFDVCLGRGVCAIRYANDFMYHYLINQEPSWARLSKGSTFDSVNSADVTALEVCLPNDAAEQTAIAAILSDMDAEIAALEEKLAKTRALKQGMMHNLLTGKIRLIDPVVVKIDEQHALSDVESIPATPKADKSHNLAFNEAVVISVLADLFGKSDFPLGRKRYTKLSYLMHRKVEQEAQGYLKKAAGPYNPKTKYAGPEKIAQAHGYMRHHEHGKYKGFIAAEKIEQAKTYFVKWYGPEIIAWLKQFRYRSNDDLECLATVDMAMQELLKQGKAADVNSIRALIASEPEWLQKLERTVFSDAGIAAAIEECRAFFTI